MPQVFSNVLRICNKELKLGVYHACLMHYLSQIDEGMVVNMTFGVIFEDISKGKTVVPSWKPKCSMAHSIMNVDVNEC